MTQKVSTLHYVGHYLAKYDCILARKFRRLVRDLLSDDTRVTQTRVTRVLQETEHALQQSLFSPILCARLRRTIYRLFDHKETVWLCA